MYNKIKLFLIIWLFALLPSAAFAQANCSGVFPANTVCGSVAGGFPKAIPLSNFTIPQTIAKVTHQWLDSYTAGTGLFTQSQPGFPDIAGPFSIAGNVFTTISANQNNWTPSGTGTYSTASTVYISGGAADRTITGLTGGLAGRIVVLVNNGTTNNIILANLSGSSSAANQFSLGQNVYLTPGASQALQYDSTNSLWRTNGSASAGIIAAVTPTVGFTVGDLISSNSSNQAADSGLAIGTAGTVAVTSQLASLPLAGASGGTGINNGSSTITVAASLTTTGAGAPTLAFPASSFTYTFQGSSDTILGRATTDTLTNKTLAATSDVLGQVTTTLGSDATGDIYYRSGGAVLTRLGIGSTGQVLTVASGLPSWATAASGTLTANSTATSGFTAGQFVYSDGSLAQASAGITTPGTGQLLLALGTITTNLKALNTTATWNASGTTFDAPWFMNITNTASHTLSKYVDIQLGGTTQFALGISQSLPAMWLGSATPSSTNYAFEEDGSNLYANTPGAFQVFMTNSIGLLDVGTLFTSIGNTAEFCWSGSADATGACDTAFYRNAAGVVEIDNGTHGTFREAKLRSVVYGGSAPTGSGSCSITTQVGGNTSGKFTASGACVAGTVILTFAFTAPNGWACFTNDQTTPTDIISQTATTTTTATLSGTMANNDVVQFSCAAY